MSKPRLWPVLRVHSFIDDLDIIVKALASELQGYDGYFKQKREKNDKK